MKKKIFSILVVLAMVIALMPMTALAAGGDTYNITYHYNYPGEHNPQNDGLPTCYTEGEGAELYDIFRESFSFNGWFANPDLTGGPVGVICADESGDKEFWAKWTGNYIVKFDLNGGEGKIADITGLGIGKQIPAVSSPTYPGHIFKGWTCNKLVGYWKFDSTTITRENQDTDTHNVVTLKADWEEGYIVNFDVDGGKPALDSVTVAKNSKINKPATVTKSGYELKCWVDKDGKEWDFANDTVTANMTLYAKWVEKASPEPDTPKTGDGNNMIAWVMILMLGLIGFVSTIIYKTRKQK